MSLNNLKNKKRDSNPNTIVGIVQGHRDGHGFVIPNDASTPDLYIPPHVMQTVMHNDEVKAVISGLDRKGRPEGKILEIISRKQTVLIGRLLKEQGVWLVAPEDNRYKQDIIIPNSGLATAKSGQVVTVELTEKPTLHSQPLGRILEVLGDIDDPGMEIEIAVRKFDIPHEFSAETVNEANRLPDQVSAAEKKGRIDLTDVPFVTIDGEDARDFDDAVYCEPAKIGNSDGHRLLVAIADVSHYVTPKSAIDADAYERATSVYFPRRVVPMLPEKLSNGICSLNPEVDRLCLVCDMLITSEGKTHGYQFYPAIIRSHARLTYTEVAAIILNRYGPEAHKRAEYVDDILHLNQAYKTLHRTREQRGALDFDTIETRIITDDEGKVERIEPYERNDAHRLIEEAMLAANVCAAEFIEHSKCSGLFRVHEGPAAEKVEALQLYLRSVGLTVKLSEEPSPKEYQQIAEMVKGRPDAQQVQMMLLRSMKQAVYTPDNEGHFGLAYAAYAHFTSPIRRYPDLLVHRVIKGILSKRKYVLEDRSALSNLEVYGSKAKREADEKAKDRAADKNAPAAKKLTKEEQAWAVAGMHCSANERRADEASRDVLAWLKCSYIREHLGEEFTGTVTSVTSFGLFIQLDEMYVEGLVHISELGGDYYQFDEMRHELVGERTGTRYALGAKIKVQVSRVDLDSRRIDFKPLNTEEPTGRRGGGAYKSTRSAEKLKEAVKRTTNRAVKAVKKRRASKRPSK